MDRRRSALFVRDALLNRSGQVPGLVFCPSQDHSENGEGGDDGGNNESVGARHGVPCNVIMPSRLTFSLDMDQR
jgi:hypothetical protein